MVSVPDSVANLFFSLRSKLTRNGDVLKQISFSTQEESLLQNKADSLGISVDDLLQQTVSQIVHRSSENGRG